MEKSETMNDMDYFLQNLSVIELAPMAPQSPYFMAR